MHNSLHPALSCVMCSDASQSSSFSMIAQIQFCDCSIRAMLVGCTDCIRLASSRTRIVQSVRCSASSLGNQLICDAQERSDGCAVTSLFQARHLDVRANVAALDR